MAMVQTARHRALVSARSIRRTRRASTSQQPARAVAAVQVFVSKLDQFLGVELFSTDQPIIVGRHRGAQLRLATDNVSREHLRITLEAGVVCVEDLGSANGTLLNRKKLSGKTDIRPSDTLQLGPYALRLRALLPVEDRAASGISEADTKVDAVLAASGSKGTEESAVELASAIDWRIYDEAIRRATGAEPARNVIHLTARTSVRPPAAPAAPLAATPAPRHDTETRVREPMDEEVAERHATARQAPAFLALLRSVTTASPLPEVEPETAPELEGPLVGRTSAARMAELERLMARLEESQAEPPREDTRPERKSPAPTDEDTLEPGDSDIISVSAFSSPFAIVPAQSMLSPERDAVDGTLAHDEGGTVTEIEAPGAPVVGRRYDSMPMAPEVIARSLLAPSGIHDPQRVQARLVTPSIESAPLAGEVVPVIGGLPTSDVSLVSSAGRVPPPLPARRVSSLAMRGVAPKGRRDPEAALARAAELARDVEMVRGHSRATAPGEIARASASPSQGVPAVSRVAPVRGTPSQGVPVASRSDAVPAPSRATLDVPVPSRGTLDVPLAQVRPTAAPGPIPSARTSLEAASRATPSAGVAPVSRPAIEAPSRATPSQGVPAQSRSPALDVPLAPSRGAPSRPAPVAPSQAVPVPSRAAPASRSVLAVRATSTPAAPSTASAQAARPATLAPIAPSRTMSLAPSITVGEGSPSGLIPVAGAVPPPLPTGRPSIPVQIPTGPRVTFTPPEALGGSGRVKVSGVPVPPPLPQSAPAAPVHTETLAPVQHVFDGVEITARTGERTLDITTLRKDGDQYVLGHPTPIGVIAPPSSHPGLRLLRIDANRNVDLVFPREVAGQLIRDGETITLHELTEGRKYSCLRLRGGDVVTVMLGIGPKQVSYHIRFVRAPRSISAVRARGQSAVSARP